MFKKIFVEEEILSHPRTLEILSFFKQKPFPIKRVEDVFGKVKKPYLDKRDNPNLFIGIKRGTLVKLAPPAYGLNYGPNSGLTRLSESDKEADDGLNGKKSVEQHYYFIHAYNCIYECEYCYLQGYFSSPDLVLFINHEAIIKEIKNVITQNPDKKLTFHSGEFSDGLALSHITKEIPLYWNFFAQHPEVNFEIRSKSTNLQILKGLKPSSNIILSFSLAPDHQAKKIEHKTPSIKSRLSAISYLTQNGYTVALHLDPIIYSGEFEKDYRELAQAIKGSLASFDSLAYVSLGVVRFTKEVFKEMRHNYPHSEILKEELKPSFDNKYRYVRPQRKFILNKVHQELQRANFPSEKLYFCMED